MQSGHVFAGKFGGGWLREKALTCVVQYIIAAQLKTGLTFHFPQPWRSPTAERGVQAAGVAERAERGAVPNNLFRSRSRSFSVRQGARPPMI